MCPLTPLLIMEKENGLTCSGASPALPCCSLHTGETESRNLPLCPKGRHLTLAHPDSYRKQAGSNPKHTFLRSPLPSLARTRNGRLMVDTEDCSTLNSPLVCKSWMLYSPPPFLKIANLFVVYLDIWQCYATCFALMAPKYFCYLRSLLVPYQF